MTGKTHSAKKTATKKVRATTVAATVSEKLSLAARSRLSMTPLISSPAYGKADWGTIASSASQFREAPGSCPDESLSNSACSAAILALRLT